MDPDGPVLSVRDLRRTYGRWTRVDAVAGVSFDVAPGEVFGLIGPDGAGKTSIMQVLALQASRRAAVGQLDEVRASLAERQIVAPVDSTVLSRPVEVGDVVSPGSAMFVMVDLNRLYVKVYVPEPEIPKLRLGDEADITVDAAIRWQPGAPWK